MLKHWKTCHYQCLYIQRAHITFTYRAGYLRTQTINGAGLLIVNHVQQSYVLFMYLCTSLWVFEQHSRHDLIELHNFTKFEQTRARHNITQHSRTPKQTTCVRCDQNGVVSAFWEYQMLFDTSHLSRTHKLLCICNPRRAHSTQHNILSLNLHIILNRRVQLRCSPNQRPLWFSRPRRQRRHDWPAAGERSYNIKLTEMVEFAIRTERVCVLRGLPFLVAGDHIYA